MPIRELYSNACLNIYLRRATFGLPNELAEEIWSELEEHALSRALQYELQGISPQKALQLAIADLGPPLKVAAQFNKVYNMSKLIGLLVFLIFGASATFYSLAQESNYHLPTLEKIPVSEVCVKSTEKPQSNIEISKEGNDETCFQYKDLNTYQGAFIESAVLEKFTKEQGGEMVKVGNDLFFHMADGSLIYSQKVFKKGNKKYIPVSSLFNPSHNNKLKIESYSPLVLSLNGLQITVGDKDSTTSQVFFHEIVPNVALPLLRLTGETNFFAHHHKPIQLETKRPNTFHHSIKTKLAADQAVMIITHSPQEGYNAFINPILAQGVLEIPSYYKKLQITNNLEEFKNNQHHDPPLAFIFPITRPTHSKNSFWFSLEDLVDPSVSISKNK